MFHDPPISQNDLAKAVGKHGVQLDQGAISRIESRSRNVSDYELIALAQCLGVAVDALFRTRLNGEKKAGAFVAHLFVEPVRRIVA